MIGSGLPIGTSKQTFPPGGGRFIDGGVEVPAGLGGVEVVDAADGADDGGAVELGELGGLGSRPGRWWS